ncbi:SDR family oxidoreductase [Defluviitoga tunisiensis]|uniref:D-mannonate oxidoreductase n=1 Tax=Defluviitoga tunisiensis TaxID=1006576 RepID=A0A0C7P3L6_DEFTU|nr:SDR family oxidoreductase [Defluviitoga tunisiensis]HOP25209.1 SDR family oxidoreductase [Defluviitoga sp.]MDD3601580.1 SDR family oxidoreductase [Defluviitoga tunisiensis]MDY0379723.1 SDR family oxidoreductase [Defluviitoga tunisiensis]CEP78469.1 D-mannonate oxidoreductase [Defluviitoga tunisiensis]HQD43610.1 SDR family oxidoreductase [Defluviitoga tunisiensis]
MNISDFFDVKDKTIVITGGAGIICSEMARTLGSLGANIVVLDLSESAMEKLSKELSEKNIKHIVLKTNVLEKEQLLKAKEETILNFGKIDVLINGAGGNHPSATTSQDKSFFELPQDAVQWVFNLNFLGTFLASQVFGEYFAEKGEGQIINISSMNAFRPLTNIPAYSAAKAAVSNFTQWLAVHMNHNYSKKIRVNAVAPGFLLTNQNKFLLTNDDGSLTTRGNKILEHTPMERFGTPQDLISTILWLISEKSSFVNGIVVPIDGGFSAYSGV